MKRFIIAQGLGPTGWAVVDTRNKRYARSSELYAMTVCADLNALDTKSPSYVDTGRKWRELPAVEGPEEQEVAVIAESVTPGFLVQQLNSTSPTGVQHWEGERAFDKVDEAKVHMNELAGMFPNDKFRVILAPR